jgi:hypothetical protein
MVKVAYAHVATHWDAVLKYERKTDLKDTDGHHFRARLNFERELLRHHLVLVRERQEDPAAAISKNTEDYGIHYIKVMASFDALCTEAERIKLKMDVTVGFFVSFTFGIRRNPVISSTLS